MQPYDKEDILDNEIRPLLNQIRKICEAHGLPFIYSCVYKETDKMESRCTGIYQSPFHENRKNAAIYKVLKELPAIPDKCDVLIQMEIIPAGKINGHDGKLGA